MWSTRQCSYLVIVIMVLTLLLSGCSGVRKLTTAITGGSGDDRVEAAEEQSLIFEDILHASYYAADTLTKQLEARDIDIDATLLSASFVNVDDLEKSSTLGRMISEQISSRMAQNGFRVLEMKLRQHSVYVKEGEGEFLLSRQLQEISTTQNGEMVVVGIYAIAEKSIYISARVVNAQDSTIITGCDYQLMRNFQVESML